MTLLSYSIPYIVRTVYYSYIISVVVRSEVSCFRFFDESLLIKIIFIDVLGSLFYLQSTTVNTETLTPSLNRSPYSLGRTMRD